MRYCPFLLLFTTKSKESNLWITSFFLNHRLALDFKLYKLFLQKFLNYCYYCHFVIIDFPIMLNLFKIERKIFLYYYDDFISLE